MLAAPTRLETARLVLRKPTPDDAEGIFAYASDAEVVRYIGFPRHATVEDSRRWVVERALREWDAEGVSAYVVEREGRILGAAGLHRREAHRGMVGYVFARAAWGQGYATEASVALIALGRSLGFVRVEAQCHVDHRGSARVLEKAGMQLEGILRRYSVLPNLSPEPQDMRLYAIT